MFILKINPKKKENLYQAGLINTFHNTPAHL